MDVASFLTPVAILGGVGLTFGMLIALAHWKLKVWEDPRIDLLSDILPSVNCGACGYVGCRAFAEAAIHGDVVPAECTVMGEFEVEEFAETLGVEAGEVEKRVARLLCAGGSDVAVQKAEYYGLESCAAAVSVSGGGKGCAWGCVGLADCAVACTFEAIRMTSFGLPVVIPENCTACNDCVVACPLDLFVLMPEHHHLIVQCRNLLDGEAATSVCSVACNACSRCVADADPGLIEMRSGLAVIDYERIELENPAAIARCPTNAIVWVDGAQVFPDLELVESEARC